MDSKQVNRPATAEEKEWFKEHVDKTVNKSKDKKNKIVKLAKKEKEKDYASADELKAVIQMSNDIQDVEQLYEQFKKSHELPEYNMLLNRPNNTIKNKKCQRWFLQRMHKFFKSTINSMYEELNKLKSVK